MEVVDLSKVKNAAALLKALSHPVRLLILLKLKKEKCKVGDLENISGLSQSGVSQHLRILRLSNIIEPHRQGKEICYEIVDEKALDILKVLCEQ